MTKVECPQVQMIGCGHSVGRLGYCLSEKNPYSKLSENLIEAIYI